MDQSRRAVESYWRSRMVDGVTADDDKVAPVYKLEEICELLRASDASIVKEVADFVLKRLDNKSPLVKQKALRLIKYAVGKSGTDFKREMQRHSAAMRQLVHYRGHPDPLRGDALNKSVRETANEAIAAIFSTEDPKPAVAAESLGKRIQGFGNTNYEPSRDDKKSFLSELSDVVGIGSASIKQGLSNFAAAHAMMTNDNGSTYKSPNLRRSLTTESERYGRYDPSEIQSESRASSGASKNAASGSWGPTSSSVPTDDTSSSQPGIKTREERLLETIVTASGVRLQPTRDALQIFLTEASKLDAVALSRALENKLNSPLWQILGTGMDTQDTSPSILLFFDKQRFIFNAGEGLQRFCTEHKIKLSKIDHIFLTRVCSETAGGLPGLVLTLAGIGDEGMSVNIWGPSDLDFLAGAMRSFIPNRAMLYTHSFGAGRNASSPQSEDSVIILDDEVVRISAMFVKPRYHNGTGSSNDSDMKPGDTAIVYACELPEIMGKFDPSKAAALGLRPGPKYRELQLGNSVQSDQFDEMVHPSDVLGPSIPGPTVLLVDCPTQYHMPELFSLQPLSCFYEDSPEQSGKKVNCIIHLGPSSVTRSVDYQNWMKKFGATQHIMAGHEIKNMEIPILKGSARISSRLNFICPQLFPSSGFWSVQPPNDVMENDKNASLEACGSVSVQNLLKFHLRPYAQLGLDRASIPNLFTYKDILQELVSEIPEVSEVPEQVRKFWQNNVDDKNTLQPIGNRMVEEPWINQKSDKLDEGTPFQEIVWRKHPRDNQETPCCVVDATREDMEITFLGTGSSQPSKYRNVSSIYINLFARGGILLDCGEGTLGQLIRRFGVNGADEAVKGLRCIWISHIHADHHTGLARILAQRSKLLRGMPHKPLLVIGPRPLERFLNAYSTLEDLDMQFLDCRHTLKSSVEAFLSENDTESAIPQLENTMFAPGSRMENYNRKPASPRDTTALANFKEVLQESGLEILYSVPVLHCPQAFGVVFRAMEKTNSAGKVIPGWKVVYSGDTRPCPALIDASRDATVLIHEATFEDSMKDEAIARNHSTTKEAIEVGTSAGVYRIILTHFSQRYPKIPVIDEVDMEKTCIAFDLMSVNLADLPVVPKVLPHLKVLFKDELAVDEADEIQEAAVY